MPNVSGSIVTLLSDDHATRVRLNSPSNANAITVLVGDTGEIWPQGSFIEAVRLPTSIASVTFAPAAGAILNAMSGTSVLRQGEYGRVSQNLDGSWDLHIHKIAAGTIKPAPMSIGIIGNALDFGSAVQHNNFYRNGISSNLDVTVKGDSFWVGGQSFWENDFSPTTPGPMPFGGSSIFANTSTGIVTFIPDVGVTIECADTLVMSVPFGVARLLKLGANLWILDRR